MRPEMKRRMWVTVALTFLLLVIWYGCMAFGEAKQTNIPVYAVMITYFVVFAVLLVTYLAYNRAFVNQDVTVEMLPDTWSDEKKRDFVEANRRRAERSRWMVMLIIPFAIVFLVEAMYLFVIDGILADWFRGLE